MRPYRWRSAAEVFILTAATVAATCSLAQGPAPFVHMAAAARQLHLSQISTVFPSQKP